VVLERGAARCTAADLLVLVGDGRRGWCRGDHEIAEAIRAANKRGSRINKDECRAKAASWIS